MQIPREGDAHPRLRALPGDVGGGCREGEVQLGAGPSGTVGGGEGRRAGAHYKQQKTESELAIKMPIRVLMNANAAPF